MPTSLLQYYLTLLSSQPTLSLSRAAPIKKILKKLWFLAIEGFCFNILTYCGHWAGLKNWYLINCYIETCPFINSWALKWAQSAKSSAGSTTVLTLWRKGNYTVSISVVITKPSSNSKKISCTWFSIMVIPGTWKQCNLLLSPWYYLQMICRIVYLTLCI